MTTQTEEGINLRPKMALTIPRSTFDAIIAEVKEKQASTKQLAEQFNYSTLAISFIRSRAIALGLLPRPVGTEKMMQVKEAKKMMGLYTFLDTSEEEPPIQEFYKRLEHTFTRIEALSIASKLGIKSRRMASYLKELVKQRKIRKVSHGQYEKYTSATKEVSRNIKITTPIQKESLPTSKFVNIKFGEMEVVVEKSASIVITKDKIIIN